MENLSVQNIMENAMYSFGGWVRFTGKVFAAVTGLAFTVTVLLYFNQDRMLYIPNPPGLPKNPSGTSINIASIFISLYGEWTASAIYPPNNLV